MVRWSLIASTALMCAAATGCGVEAEPDVEARVTQSALVQVRSSSFGSLRMYKYVPANLPSNSPLVLALHGCTQSAGDYEAAGWNDLADRFGFAVVYAEQTTSDRCFKWYERSQTARGTGEVAQIKNMVDRMIADHGSDPSRVYVTGLSAGGAMTAAMLAAYPDVFDAGAVMAGLPYRCADGIIDAFSCMNSGKNLTQSQWADRVIAANRSFAGTYPRVSIWHGTSDYTVRPVNADALASQWTGVHGVSATPTVRSTQGTVTRQEFQNMAGDTLVETWSIDRMGHGTPVDPANGCGRIGGFILDVGVCSSLEVARFFGLDPEEPVEPIEPPVEPIEPPVEPVEPVEPPEEPVEPVEPIEPPEEPVEPIEPPVDPVEPPVEPTPPAFACQEWYSSNYGHEQAGRGYVCSGYVCTQGSDERLGLWNLFFKSWVRETAQGYFEKGRCN